MVSVYKNRFRISLKLALGYLVQNLVLREWVLGSAGDLVSLCSLGQWEEWRALSPRGIVTCTGHQDTSSSPQLEKGCDKNMSDVHKQQMGIQTQRKASNPDLQMFEKHITNSTEDPISEVMMDF